MKSTTNPDRLDLSVLDELSARISAEEAKVKQAEEIFSQAEAALAEASQDDPELSAAEIVSRRREASDLVEVRKVELDRVRSAASSARRSLDVEVRDLKDLAHQLLTEKAGEREQEVVSTMRSLVPEDEWHSLHTVCDLRTFIRTAKGVGDRRHVAERLNRLQIMKDADLGRGVALLRQAAELL